MRLHESIRTTCETHATSSFFQLPSIQPSPRKKGKTSSARNPRRLETPPIPGEVTTVLVLAVVLVRSNADVRNVGSLGVGTKASESVSS